MVVMGRYYRLAPIITDIVKVLILVPQFQYIFNWTIVNSSGFIQSLREVEDIRDIEISLKFHPRHGRIEYYQAIMDLSRFNIQHGDNFLEILDDADIVVAFESSSALIDCILCSKPLVYINDYLEQFDDEVIYHDLIAKFTSIAMLDLAETIVKLRDKEVEIEAFLPKYKLQDVLYAKGDDAGELLAKYISIVLAQFDKQDE